MYLNWWDTASRISEPPVFCTHISDLQNLSGCVMWKKPTFLFMECLWGPVNFQSTPLGLQGENPKICRKSADSNVILNRKNRTFTGALNEIMGKLGQPGNQWSVVGVFFFVVSQNFPQLQKNCGQIPLESEWLEVRPPCCNSGPPSPPELSPS